MKRGITVDSIGRVARGGNSSSSHPGALGFRPFGRQGQGRTRSRGSNGHPWRDRVARQAEPIRKGGMTPGISRSAESTRSRHLGHPTFTRCPNGWPSRRASPSNRTGASPAPSGDPSPSRDAKASRISMSVGRPGRGIDRDGRRRRRLDDDRRRRDDLHRPGRLATLPDETDACRGQQDSANATDRPEDVVRQPRAFSMIIRPHRVHTFLRPDGTPG